MQITSSIYSTSYGAKRSEEHETASYTYEALTKAFSSNHEQDIIIALNYLYNNEKNNECFIEQNLLMLLQQAKLSIRQLAANFAHHFNVNNILSAKGVEGIVSIMKNNPEIVYYAEMYFPKK